MPTPPKDPTTGRFVSPDQSIDAKRKEFLDQFEITEPGTTPPAAPAAPAARPDPAPPAPKFPKGLLRLAKSMGLEEAAIPDDWDADKLSAALEARSEERSQSLREKSELINKWTGFNKVDTGQMPKAPEPEPKAAAPANLIEGLTKRYGDQLDGKYLQALDGAISDILESRIGAALKPHLERLDKVEQGHKALIQAEQTRQDLSLAEQADQFFAKHPDIYGEQTHKSIDRKSPEFQRRQFLVAQIRDFGDIGGALNKSHDLLYGHLPKKPTETPPPKSNGTPAKRDGDAERILAERQSEWEKGQVAAPTSREGVPEKGKEAAVAGIREVLTRAASPALDDKMKKELEDELPD